MTNVLPIDRAVAKQLAHKLLLQVYKIDHLSMVDVEKLSPDHTRISPGYSWEHVESNLVFWPDVSLELICAIKSVIKSELATFTLGQTAFIAYMVDGKLLRLPIAHTARRYKRPHWLPVLLSVPESLRASGKERSPCLSEEHISFIDRIEITEL